MSTGAVLDRHDRQRIAAQLEQVLTEMVRLHERLLEQGEALAGALRSADPARVESCIVEQSGVVQRISELEQRRRDLARDLMGVAAERREPTIAELIALVPAGARESLKGVRDRLRDAVESVGRRYASLGLAAQTLRGHLDGLIGQVGRRLSHAGTYGNAGRIESRVQIVSGIDMTR